MVTASHTSKVISVHAFGFMGADGEPGVMRNAWFSKNCNGVLPLTSELENRCCRKCVHDVNSCLGIKNKEGNRSQDSIQSESSQSVQSGPPAQTNETSQEYDNLDLSHLGAAASKRKFDDMVFDDEGYSGEQNSEDSKECSEDEVSIVYIFLHNTRN